MGLTSEPTPHPTPLDEDLLDSLRLIRSHRVGPVTWHRLVAEHGSSSAALYALPNIALASGVRDYACFSAELAKKELDAGRRIGATPLIYGQEGYPKALLDLSDAPPFLWAKGDLSLLNRDIIALIGARNASSLGLRMTRRLAEGLGQAEIIVASGLARGIDTAAHEASLATGTIAVQAGGIDVFYPEENTELAQNIAQNGCLISEQAIGLRPQARHFPLRNRLVSGLSHAVIVVEAASRSGSLLTAKSALDQGREVMAVPGHPFDARAAGCNVLLRDGATLIRGIDDIFEALSSWKSDFRHSAPQERSTEPAPPKNLDTRTQNVTHLHAPHSGLGAPKRPESPPAKQALHDIADLHQRILNHLSACPLAEDQLIRDLSMPPAAVSAQLLTLELEGKIIRSAGGFLSRL